MKREENSCWEEERPIGKKCSSNGLWEKNSLSRLLAWVIGI